MRTLPYSSEAPKERKNLEQSFVKTFVILLCTSILFYFTDQSLLRTTTGPLVHNSQRLNRGGSYIELAHTLELKEDYDRHHNISTTTTSASYQQSNSNKTIYFIGWEYKEIQSLIFPEYTVHVPNSKNQRWARQSHPTDILVIGGMDQVANYQLLHRSFTGKILVVGPEPDSLMPMPIHERMFQLSGNISRDMSYDAITNPSSHYFQNYHGLRLFLGNQQEHHYKLFDEGKRPKWNGLQNKIIYANSHCVSHRQNAVNALSNIVPVDASGRCTLLHNPNVTKIEVDIDRNSRDSNWMYYRNYKYCISMENTQVDGYISEKIFYAFIGGCVPIYYGTLEVYDVFNANSFIFYDPQNPQLALQKIRYLESNRSAYEEMLSEPILKNGTDTINKFFSMSDNIGDGSLKKQIRTMMGIS